MSLPHPSRALAFYAAVVCCFAPVAVVVTVQARLLERGRFGVVLQ